MNTYKQRYERLVKALPRNYREHATLAYESLAKIVQLGNIAEYDWPGGTDCYFWVFALNPDTCTIDEEFGANKFHINYNYRREGAILDHGNDSWIYANVGVEYSRSNLLSQLVILKDDDVVYLLDYDIACVNGDVRKPQKVPRDIKLIVIPMLATAILTGEIQFHASVINKLDGYLGEIKSTLWP